MKKLSFYFRGQQYLVNKKGEIKANGLTEHSKTWIFRGGAKHHMQNYPTITLKDAFEKPELLDGCLGFDIDHGTYRAWGGQYNGKLPRITNAQLV